MERLSSDSQETEVPPSLNSICSLLDENFLKYYELLEEYVNTKKSLQEFMKQGLWNLSRARISKTGSASGLTQINSIHYPSNMEASLKFQMNDLEETDEYFSFFEEDNFSNENKTEELYVPKKESNLILRKGQKQENLKDDQVIVYHSHTTHILEEKPISRLKDPLFWFGAFPSNNLRLSQQDFKKAMSVILKLTNLNIQLNEISDKIKQLQDQKANLISK